MTFLVLYPRNKFKKSCSGLIRQRPLADEPSILNWIATQPSATRWDFETTSKGFRLFYAMDTLTLSRRGRYDCRDTQRNQG